MFKQAVRSQSRLRLTIDGPAGSGKSYTALRFAHSLATSAGGRIAVIDTERGSASKYVGEAPDGIPWTFDVAELKDYSPERYTEMIELAGRNGYNVLIIDSFSHAWEGKGGALEIKDRISDRPGENAWTAWRPVTPIIRRMIDAILQSPCHVITTMRSKMDYVQEYDEKLKKVIVRRVGMAPIQRPGMEYEFDIICDIDWAHIMVVTKSRCSAVDGLQFEKPGPLFMERVLEWLDSGKPRPAGDALPPAMLVDTPATYQVQPPQVNMDSLTAMLDRFSVDEIIAAGNGRIPATDEEVAAVLATLEGADA